MNKTYITESGIFANRRTRTIAVVILAGILLALIVGSGLLMNESAYRTDFTHKNLAPSMSHLFGTDWMGRDMFARTIKGLSTSIVIGLLASVIASVMAVIMGIAAGVYGKFVDSVFNWMVDLFMGIPHLVFLILVSVMLGKGVRGVMVGISITHWCILGRIVRAEVLSLRHTQYIQAARKLGKSRWWIARKHLLPHVFPQFLVGLILLFPHAIMHEASITFLGFGLPPEQPAVGVILSESMEYLTTGMWWLAIMPGLSLLLVALLFQVIGDNVSLLIDPFSAQE